MKTKLISFLIFSLLPCSVLADQICSSSNASACNASLDSGDGSIVLGKDSADQTLTWSGVMQAYQFYRCHYYTTDRGIELGPINTEVANASCVSSQQNESLGATMGFFYVAPDQIIVGGRSEIRFNVVSVPASSEPPVAMITCEKTNYVTCPKK